MALPGQHPQLLLLEVVDRQHVGCHHDHHGDVEGEERANHQEVIIVHFTQILCWHDVLLVDEGQYRDGGGEEHAQPPGQHHPEQGGVFTLRPLLQWSSYPTISSNRDEHEVEDRHRAGKDITGLVENTPELGQRP